MLERREVLGSWFMPALQLIDLTRESEKTAQDILKKREREREREREQQRERA